MTTAASAGSGDPHWRVISRTGEYALRVVLDLARRDPADWNAAGEMAARLRIPVRYLARVLNALARAGTLDSVRGARGGFRLSRPPEELTLAAVLAPFDPVGAPPGCLLREQPCGAGEPCLAHARWHALARDAWVFFRQTTIADLSSQAASEPLSSNVT